MSSLNQSSRPSSASLRFSYLEHSPQSNSKNVTKLSTEQEIELSIMYLCDMKDPKLILVDNRTVNAVTYLQYHSGKVNELQVIFKHMDVFPILTNMINYYKSELKAFLSINDRQQALNGVGNIYKIQFIVMRYLMSFLWNVTNCLKKFCYEFHDKQGTQAILDYMNDSKLVSELVTVDFNIKPISLNGMSLLKAFAGAFNNLSSIAEHRRKDFAEMNAPTVILKILNLIICKSDHNLQVTLNLALANVVNDHEIETLPDIKNAISIFVKLISKMADMIASSKVEREMIDIEENEVISVEICSLEFHIYEVVNGLYKLAVNDAIKYEIYETNNAKDYLEKIIYHGNDIEKALALKLLWQLCFDKRISKCVELNNKLCQFIGNILKQKQTSNIDVKKYCEGILWSIEHTPENEKNKNKDSETKNEKLLEDDKHVMISYNSESRKLCVAIKALLEQNGHKVWIDVENIHGSSLEAMAQAIEQSKCVLICMTEKYKQSPNCRAEAEYTFRLNKPIVPLIMQKDYMPDGWLGIIIGTKIYINFTKYSFEEAGTRLIKEISSSIGLVIDILKAPAVKTTTLKPVKNFEIENSKHQIENWKKENITDWLEKAHVCSEIKELLKDFNGDSLCTLNMVKNESPDYFYQVISKNNTIDVLSVLNFTREFMKLF